MKIEHAALYVKDLEGTRDFFIKYFGAVSNSGYHNEKTGFRSYFLTFSQGARLEIMSRPDITEGDIESRFGYAHIAISTGSREKVDSLTAVLKNDGYKIISAPRVTGDGYYESCISDKEGNVIELTV